MGTYSSAFKTSQTFKKNLQGQKVAREAAPLLSQELTQHRVLGLVVFSATGQKIMFLLLDENLT